VNASTDETCRRCGETLNLDGEPLIEEVVVEKRRSLLKRATWIAGTTLLLLFVAYMSMLLTSDDLPFEQHQIVDRAITVVESKGFSKQTFLLKRLVRYRATDSWWNRYLGHRDAYAATNFPFEIVTLYPEFFEATTDDLERAAILLHEAEHLLGAGEEKALEATWRNKGKLGWVEANYGQTRVWNNTKELTQRQLPDLFTCGPDGKSDCIKIDHHEENWCRKRND
jgi:hypothetical protein